MRHLAALAVLLSLWLGFAHAAPPPAGTTVWLSPSRVLSIPAGADPRVWLVAQGVTPASSTRSATAGWTITLEETLTAQQKTDLYDAIIAATDGVSVQ